MAKKRSAPSRPSVAPALKKQKTSTLHKVVKSLSAIKRIEVIQLQALLAIRMGQRVPNHVSQVMRFTCEEEREKPISFHLVVKWLEALSPTEMTQLQAMVEIQMSTWEPCNPSTPSRAGLPQKQVVDDRRTPRKTAAPNQRTRKESPAPVNTPNLNDVPSAKNKPSAVNRKQRSEAPTTVDSGPVRKTSAAVNHKPRPQLSVGKDSHRLMEGSDANSLRPLPKAPVNVDRPLQQVSPAKLKRRSPAAVDHMPLRESSVAANRRPLRKSSDVAEVRLGQETAAAVDRKRLPATSASLNPRPLEGWPIAAGRHLLEGRAAEENQRSPWGALTAPAREWQRESPAAFNRRTVMHKWEPSSFSDGTRAAPPHNQVEDSRLSPHVPSTAINYRPLKEVPAAAKSQSVTKTPPVELPRWLKENSPAVGRGLGHELDLLAQVNHLSQREAPSVEVCRPQLAEPASVATKFVQKPLDAVSRPRCEPGKGPAVTRKLHVEEISRHVTAKKRKKSRPSLSSADVCSEKRESLSKISELQAWATDGEVAPSTANSHLVKSPVVERHNEKPQKQPKFPKKEYFKEVSLPVTASPPSSTKCAIERDVASKAAEPVRTISSAELADMSVSAAKQECWEITREYLTALKAHKCSMWGLPLDIIGRRLLSLLKLHLAKTSSIKSSAAKENKQHRTERAAFIHISKKLINSYNGIDRLKDAGDASTKYFELGMVNFKLTSKELSTLGRR